jgi:phosphatidylcholine synthase
MIDNRPIDNGISGVARSPLHSQRHRPRLPRRASGDRFRLSGAVVPSSWALPVASTILLSSAYGVNRTDAKTAENFFTGFPSYWNVVTFYLLIARWSPSVNAVILVVFAVLVFVPIRYLYPSRTPRFPVVTNVGGAVWAGLILLMLWQYPAVPAAMFWVSLAYPAYYLLLSFLLHFSLISSKT